jgi:hypothetical protein
LLLAGVPDHVANEEDIQKNKMKKSKLPSITRSAKAKAAAPGGKGAVAGSGEYIIAKGDNFGTIAKN